LEKNQWKMTREALSNRDWKGLDDLLSGPPDGSLSVELKQHLAELCGIARCLEAGIKIAETRYNTDAMRTWLDWASKPEESDELGQQGD